MKRLLVIIFSFFAIGVSAQFDTISLRNPSFEDSPRKGGYYTNTPSDQQNRIKGWFDCGIYNFKNETAPDIHPSDYWSDTKQPSDGRTYLCMVTRDNDSWESVSQELDIPLKGGNCYSFSVQLSKSERYISGSRLNASDKPNYNYTTPVVFRLWGGYGYCGTAELLAESTPVNNSEWKTYSFKLSPKANYRYITFEAFYKVPVVFPYNGHVLVDKCSDIIQINCEDELLAEVEEPKKKLPPHKRVKQNKKRTPRKTKPQNTDVASSKKSSKKILNLDRNKIRKGQTIEIRNLYFVADSATINTESFVVLDEVVEFLQDNSDIIIEIGGHTNGVPSHDYCDWLSENRAKAVASYLANKGITSERLKYKGYGKRRSIASNLTKEGRKKNQRVEIKILSIG